MNSAATHISGSLYRDFSMVVLSSFTSKDNCYTQKDKHTKNDEVYSRLISQYEENPR